MARVSAETRRRQLWALRQKLLLEAEQHDTTQIDQDQATKTGDPKAHQTAARGRKNRFADQDRAHQQACEQFEATAGHRRRWNSAQIDQGVAEDAELQSDAERNARRLGVHQHAQNPGLSIAASMIAARGEDKRRVRTRITSSTGTGRGSKRDLLHPGGMKPHVVEHKGGLGPKQVTVHRPHGLPRRGAVVTV